jgi:hypothetical protein
VPDMACRARRQAVLMPDQSRRGLSCAASACAWRGLRAAGFTSACGPGGHAPASAVEVTVDESQPSGAHARPPAGRVRSPMVLTEVVAWAKARRARSAPSSVSR